MNGVPRIPIPWIAALVLCAGVVVRASAEAPEPTARPGASAQASDLLARFEGGQITVADLAAAVGHRSPPRRARLFTPEERASLLQELVTYQLLVLEAERRGYARDLAVLDARRGAAIEAMLEASRKPGQSPEQTRAALVARLRALHPPRVRADLIDAVVLDPIGAIDQPQGFQPAPADPRLAPRHVEPDGM